MHTEKLSDSCNVNDKVCLFLELVRNHFLFQQKKNILSKIMKHITVTRHTLSHKIMTPLL